MDASRFLPTLYLILNRVCHALPIGVTSKSEEWIVTVHINQTWINILIAFGIYEVLMFIIWLCSKGRENLDPDIKDEGTCCCMCCKFKLLSGVELFMCFHIKFLIAIGQCVNKFVTTCCQTCRRKSIEKPHIKYELVEKRKSKR